MEALLKNETVRKKIKSLSPQVRPPREKTNNVVSEQVRHKPTCASTEDGQRLEILDTESRKAFIESLLDLYEQETEEMIDVIEESRMELRGDFLHIAEETKSLRAESRMLEEKRNEDGRRTGMTSRSSDSRLSRLSYINEQENSKSLAEYRKRGKRRLLGTEDARSKSTDRPPDGRAVSVLSTRSLPTPISSKTVEQEKDEVMKNLKTATYQNEVERQRQADLIAERRERRRQQKQTTEEKALELLEKALQMDKKLAEKKEEQDRKLRERLEERKKNIRKERETPAPVEIDFGDIDPHAVPQSNKHETRTDRHDKHEPRPRSETRTDRHEPSPKPSSDRNKHEPRADKHEPRPVSGKDRNVIEIVTDNRKNEHSQRNERESSKDRKKESKKDIKSVYDFGDF